MNYSLYSVLITSVLILIISFICTKMRIYIFQVNGFSEYSKENNNQNNINNNNNTLNNQEYILDDDECPLAILMNHPQSQGKL